MTIKMQLATNLKPLNNCSVVFNNSYFINQLYNTWYFTHTNNCIANGNRHRRLQTPKVEYFSRPSRTLLEGFLFYPASLESISAQHCSSVTHYQTLLNFPHKTVFVMSIQHTTYRRIFHVSMWNSKGWHIEPTWVQACNR